AGRRSLRQGARGRAASASGRRRHADEGPLRGAPDPAVPQPGRRRVQELGKGDDRELQHGWRTERRRKVSAGRGGSAGCPCKDTGACTGRALHSDNGPAVVCFSLSFQKVRVFQHPPDPVQEPLGADHAVQEHDSLALSPVLPGEMLEKEERERKKLSHPATFGPKKYHLRECMCEIEGQVPCPAFVPLPKEMRGKYKAAMKNEA
uniref:Mitochondrial ribosomal protein S25 n=1 Tax=Geospiza parvula TaxID=87175 RepID=A0A8C3M9D5_GEOPR